MRRSDLLVAGLGLGLAAAGGWALAEWLAVGAPATAGGAPRRGFASPPVTAAAAPTLLAGASRPAVPVRGSSRHHRGSRAPSELAGIPLERMGTQLRAALDGLAPQLERCSRSTRAGGSGARADPAALIRTLETSALVQNQAPLPAEHRALLRDLEAAIAANQGAAPRTLMLDVETGDGELRIVDVPSGNEGSAFLDCARQELSGRIIPVPGATAGSRLSVALPLTQQ